MCGAPGRGPGSMTPPAGSGRGAGGDPDRHQPQLARVPLAGRDPLPQLGRVEADGQVGLDGGARDLATRRIDPGGDIAGDHRRPAAVDPAIDCRARRPLAARRRNRCRRSRRRRRAGAGHPGVEVARRLIGQELGRLDLEAHLGEAGGRQPDRRRRCCPCRRRSAPAPAERASATASARAVPAASISCAEGTLPDRPRIDGAICPRRSAAARTRAPSPSLARQRNRG